MIGLEEELFLSLRKSDQNGVSVIKPNWLMNGRPALSPCDREFVKVVTYCILTG